MTHRVALPVCLFILAAAVVFRSAQPVAVAQLAQPSQPTAPPWNRHMMPRSMDGDGIAELFERVARNGGVAFLPAGVYRINRTIELDGLGPIRIEGESFGVGLNPNGGGLRARATRLVWTGEPGGTMFHLNGSAYQSFSHMQFDGGGKAGKIFQLTSKPGWSSGGQRFDRVLFTNVDTAIQCGSVEGEFTNSDLYYNEVTFNLCKTGLKVLNHQSVNHHFSHLGVSETNVALDFQRGGNLTVVGWAAGTFDLLLRVGYGGPNAGAYRFIGGRPEMNGYTKRHARLLEALPIDCANVVFEGTQECHGPINDKLPDNEDEAAFVVGPRAIVTIRDHYHLRRALDNRGGVYRDYDSRFHHQPNESVARGATTQPAGITHISGATDVRGLRLADVHKE